MTSHRWLCHSRSGRSRPGIGPLVALRSCLVLMARSVQQRGWARDHRATVLPTPGAWGASSGMCTEGPAPRAVTTLAQSNPHPGHKEELPETPGWRARSSDCQWECLGVCQRKGESTEQVGEREIPLPKVPVSEPWITSFHFNILPLGALKRQFQPLLSSLGFLMFSEPLKAALGFLPAF